MLKVYYLKSEENVTACYYDTSEHCTGMPMVRESIIWSSIKKLSLLPSETLRGISCKIL